MPKLSRRARILLIIGVALLLTLIIGSRLLGTYVDWLWYGEVGARSVFATVLTTRILLFFAIGLLVGGSLALCLVIAYRTRPMFVPVTGVEDPLARYRSTITQRAKLFGIGIPVVVGLIAAATGQAQWQVVQLFIHGGSFGQTDPQFGNDIGFYAFTLPFIVWLKNWLFIAIAIAFFASLIAHYVFGGVRIAGRGGQLSKAARMQLAILAGLFVLMKAFAYFFDRYELLFSDRNEKFTGASYTDLNAVLPAKLILLCIAVFCAAAFFVGAFMRNLQLPAIATVLMLLSSIVVGTAWPAIMEQFSVRANAREKEALPIERNIQATRQAYGITPSNVEKENYDPGSVAPTADEVKAQTGTLDNVRLLDPNILSPTFTQLQQGRNFFGFTPRLNLDRYNVDGQVKDYVVAAREINPNGLAAAQRDWINRHLVYTHGNGFVAAPANDVDPAEQAGDQGGYPNFQVSDLTSKGRGGLRVDQPRIYYGELNNDYAIVGSSRGEAPREYDTDTKRYSYNGRGGVPLSSFFNKLVFAAYYGERNFLFSDDIGSNSKIMYKRDPAERVKGVAPWLTVDGDPYPAVVNGRIKWIVDGYTTLDNYPYAQRTELSAVTNDSTNDTNEPGFSRQPEREIGYIRNSVKATVDAYDGSVNLYQVDKNDPVLKAWKGVFPGTVKPASAIPESLRQHFRYPEDLFKVQRDLLTKYHVNDAGQFYSSQTFWDVPPDPTVKAGQQSASAPASTTPGGGTGTTTPSGEPPQPPYYVLAQAPGQDKPTFQLTSSLTSLQRQNLAAWVSVSSDPSTYGKFTVLTLPTNTQTQGPVQVQNQFDSTDEVTENRTLFNNPAVDAEFGNMLTLPVAGKLLYVEPIYIQRNDTNAFPQLARVLVEYNGRVGFSTTFEGALNQALTGQDTAQPGTGGNSGSSSDTSTTSPPTSSAAPPASGGSTSNPQVVADIKSALEGVAAAKRTGDLGQISAAYEQLEAAAAKLEQAQNSAGSSGGGGNGGG
jgi:uncharacterized membrane protein (UPF0182 family)